MDRNDLMVRAKDPNLISGIYNYCDRWCERCTFTSRCLNYSISEEKFGDLEDKDLQNEAFWDRLSEVFRETISMVSEMAAELDIDLDSIEDDVDDTDGLDRAAGEPVHLLSRLSLNYAKATSGWFEANEDLLRERMPELNRLRPVSPGDRPVQDAVDISDAIDVIRWYQYQIHVKLDRAIQSASDEAADTDPQDMDPFPKDSDGSAKVALIGTDRSLLAWNVLSSRLPIRKEDSIDLIRMLDSIRKRTEMHFPDARSFVRPGFDDCP